MTMTPDQCFDEMAVVLGLPKDTGYTDILAVVKKLKEQLAIKEAEQEEEANLICSLKEENKKLQQYYDKWSIILSEIDGDDFCDLLKDCGWEENDEGELVRSEEPAGAEELTEPESDKP